MSVDGTYKIEIDSPIGKRESTLILNTEGEELSGSMEGPVGAADFNGGKVSGNQFTCDVKINTLMGEMEFSYKGIVKGEEISGNVKMGNYGTTTFKGKRV
jgi:hypothetical protein